MTGLWLTLATVLAALIAAQQDWPPVIRLIGAIPLVLVFPGYSLVRAVFVARQIPWPTRLALVLGLSLSAAAIGGVVLQFAASRVSGPGWLILLGGVTIAAVVVRGLRTRQGVSPVATSLHALPRLSRMDMLFLVAAAGIAVTAVGQALLTARGSFTPNAPQLWIAPVGDPVTSLEIGVSNLQPTGATFRVVMTGTTHDPATFSVELAARQTWRTTISTNEARQGQPIDIRLYSDTTGPDPIREVRFWPAVPVAAYGDPSDQSDAGRTVHSVVT